MTDKHHNTKPDADHSKRFLTLLQDSLDSNTFVKAVLSKYRGTERDLVRISLRQVIIRDQKFLSFVYRYKTKDITKNLPTSNGIFAIREMLATFGHAQLFTSTDDIQLSISKKGGCALSSAKASNEYAPSNGHDREKQRFIDPGKPFLTELGVTNEQHQLIPSMSKKWKQINKFIEVIDHAFESSGLKNKGNISVVDFGSGKGYLTFAIHDHLRNSLGIKAQVTGVELREDLIKLCNDVVKKLKIEGLSFEHGDIKSHSPGKMDIMIALHACDTATDFAIHKGIRSGASIIMCSPCCHKQIRPQMKSPSLLKPILKHGIHLGQEAEMITDTLRALLLEAEGYATQIFEFIALEHTSKNKMILAVKRPAPVRRQEILAQIKEIKDFYGISEHCLETLLAQL